MIGRRGGAPNARVTAPRAAASMAAAAPTAPSSSAAPGTASSTSAPSPAALKSARQRAIRELVARSAIGSQQDLVEALRARGMDVTQATVSRDVAELGLVKITRADGHVYVAAADLATGGAPTSDALLRRLLADIPVRVGRSGLILVLTAPPGTASSIAQAIDQSTLTDQVGTLAGDNTLLVLFADEARLEHWLARFRGLGPAPDLEPEAVPVEARDLVGAGAATGGPAQNTDPSATSGLQEVSR
jgi:transcriptional regulator of arginine metabolism